MLNKYMSGQHVFPILLMTTSANPPLPFLCHRLSPCLVPIIPHRPCSCRRAVNEPYINRRKMQRKWNLRLRYVNHKKVRLLIYYTVNVSHFYFVRLKQNRLDNLLYLVYLVDVENIF